MSYVYSVKIIFPPDRRLKAQNVLKGRHGVRLSATPRTRGAKFATLLYKDALEGQAYGRPRGESCVSMGRKPMDTTWSTCSARLLHGRGFNEAFSLRAVMPQGSL